MDEIDRACWSRLSEDGRLSYSSWRTGALECQQYRRPRATIAPQWGPGGISRGVRSRGTRYTLHSLTDVNLKESVDRHEFERDLSDSRRFSRRCTRPESSTISSHRVSQHGRIPIGARHAAKTLDARRSKQHRSW